MNEITSVKFRMYNTGSVGDCLLLLFMKADQPVFRMLVDCGGWNTNSTLITPCVEDIRTTCNGELDLLVMTHQHEDHVSGFNQARKVFDQIKVKEVWMSWIENPGDPVAKIVKENYGKKLKSAKKQVQEIVQEFSARARKNYGVRGMDKRMTAKLNKAEESLGLLEFEEGLGYGKKLAAGSRTNDDAVAYLKRKGDKLKYWKPGEVINGMAGIEGAKFFILGPPRDKDMRFFTITEDKEEIYHFGASAEQEGLKEEALQNFISTAGVPLEQKLSPFGTQYQLTGVEKVQWEKNYNNSDMSWRQIENSWQDAALNIALRANRFTNNTSLAMAIELAGFEKVILLPGDAQSGNWMGWHKPDVTKALKSKGGKDTRELLSNTVLYKVGHHCSENGTASLSGLDMMKSEELVACVPLIKDKIPAVWHPEGFPASQLYAQLIKKTNGRMIRTDEGIVTDPRAKKLRSQLSTKEKRSFTEGFAEGSCYMEYTLKNLAR